MAGSTLEAMAMAVEEAFCVVTVISSGYKDSAACRTEAEYAYQLRKPIIPVKNEDYTATGWLGAVTGTKLWFSFAGELSRPAFKAKTSELLKAINRHEPARHPSQGGQSAPTDASAQELADAKARLAAAEIEIKRLRAETRQRETATSTPTDASGTVEILAQLKNITAEVRLVNQRLERIENRVGIPEQSAV